VRQISTRTITALTTKISAFILIEINIKQKLFISNCENLEHRKKYFFDQSTFFRIILRH